MRGCRILGGFDQADRRAVLVGAVVLGSLAVVYPILAEQAARPLAVFVLPCLMTAVLGGWRPTVLVGSASLVVAVVLGLLGPLDGKALSARWLIIAVGVVVGALAAAARERQSSRLADLHETMALRAAFERALAPAPVPPEGFVAVSRYRTAEARMQLGGDFVEAVALPDGRLAVLIGDVCGHGPREAAFGAALRAGWKSIALGGKQDPAGWVDALHSSFFLDGRIDTFATMCTGYFDLSERVTRLCSVGHPPPVLLDRRARPLDLPPAPPLGLGKCDAWTATELPWSGQPLLLYTDGLVENPNAQGPPQRWGEAGLLSWLNAHGPVGRIDEFADTLVAAATEGREARDDIAVLIVAAA
jgi:serine phosphatase RsbU (regulator of sigma subunit)